MVQQIDLTLAPLHGFAAATFPPPASTAAGATFPPLAAESAALLRAVLPTNQPAVLASPLSSTRLGALGPSAPGENRFAATYGPQIYAVFLNGLVASTLATSAIAAGTGPRLGAEMSLAAEPVSESESTAKATASLTALAGTGSIFALPAPPPAQTTLPTDSRAK